jgi:type II secretory pathway predicted ATPase ExeA
MLEAQSQVNTTHAAWMQEVERVTNEHDTTDRRTELAEAFQQAKRELRLALEEAVHEQGRAVPKG